MMLQDIVRRLRMGQSINGIKGETGKHRTVIRKLRGLALEYGWLAGGCGATLGSGTATDRTTVVRARRRRLATRWRNMLIRSRAG